MSRRNQGSKWCSPAKRRRVYERDQWRCVWCGRQCVRHAQLATPDLVATIDHLITRADGGSNDPQNLVTACHGCNSHRRHEPALDFALVRARHAGWLPTQRVQAFFDIATRIMIATATPVPKRKSPCKRSTTRSAA